MVITKLKYSTKNSEKVHIYLDEEYGFTLKVDQVLKHNLYKGQEISDEELSAFRKEYNFAKAYQKVVDYCQVRPRSEYEIKQYFYKKKSKLDLQEAEKDELISKLTEKNVLNDQEFAKWWIRQRKSFKPKSKKEMWAELYKKGISRDIIETELQLAYNDEDEYSAAKQLLEKKYANYQDFDINKRNKAMAYLSRKGYSWDTIKRLFS